MYCLNSITKWAYKWEENGWNRGIDKKTNQPMSVKNLDLIKACHNRYKEFLLHGGEIIWVRGHSGNVGNDIADELAKFAVVSKERGWKLLDIQE